MPGSGMGIPHCKEKGWYEGDFGLKRSQTVSKREHQVWKGLSQATSYLVVAIESETLWSCFNF